MHKIRRFFSIMANRQQKEQVSRTSEIKRGASPLVDENGFKIRKVYEDARNMTAYQRLSVKANNCGNDKNQLNCIPKNKTMREEDEDMEYTIDGPLRRVSPYFFTYMTHCKLRWRDRKLFDVFTNEFRLYPEEYYIHALSSGKVTLNDRTATMDSIVRNGDLICHRMHRHEPPVTSRKIKIVYQDDDIVVIDKPSGIPVHPTGRYRHNTVTFILEKEFGIKAHPCNRLDRLTSGLMFLGKTAKSAENMVKQIRDREVSKQYIAKVLGEFPANGKILVDKPLFTVDPRLALNIVDEKNGKPAETTFLRISYDGENSLVLCKPHTGRTHQIRVHLQYLGYPIINDPLYSSPGIWGDKLGRNGEFEIETVKEKLSKVGKKVPTTSWLHQDSSGEVLSGEKCDICQQEIYTDPGPNDLDLYLHAFRYDSTSNDESKCWSYQTDLPNWATDQSEKYMKIALEEAKKCGPTKTAFCVGAVLVNSGNILETGYSRELEGNTHAEQCALEKYFKKNEEREIPLGTEIYTTMEPCSERLSGNLPCLDRILEFKDKFTTCFVGVMEPSTFIGKNISYEKLTSNNINYIKVSGFDKEAISIARHGHDE